MFKFHAEYEIYRNGSFVDRIKNLVTTEGLNSIVTIYFKNGSPYTATPYVGLIDNDGFIAIVGSDTAALITTTSPGGGNNGWKEFTDYVAAARQGITLGTALLGSIDNSASPRTYVLTADLTLKGIFLISDFVKGGTTGVLISEAVLVTPVSYLNGDTISIVVYLTATSA